MNSLKKITFFLLVTLCNFTVLAQYGGGSGTLNDPYLISTPSHLVYLSETTADWNGKSFKLENHIDMTGQSFTPIGKNGQLFSGFFDGNNKEISNLVVTPNPLVNDGSGLFGGINGEVTRLGVANITINAPGVNRVGGIVGFIDGDGSVTYCYTKGGTINVGASNGWAGGIVGAMFKPGTQSVEDCYSSANITAGWGSGGVVGATRGQHVINRVAFYGTISSTDDYAIVFVQDDNPTGNKDGIPPTNAFYSISSGANDLYGTGLNASQLQDSNSYTTFDFTDVWKIDPTLNYAVLQNSTPVEEPPFFDLIKNKRVTSNADIEWINLSPGTSGYCEEFWCHPTDANVMFSGADMHASFGTWDGGETWQTLKDHDGNGMDMRRVIDIKFSLQDPNYGMAFSNNQTGSSDSGEIYETTDKGKTWSVLSNMGKCHSKLAVHPTNDNIWFLGAGDFWNVKSNHRSLAKPEGIKQGRANYGHVWKTTDKGATWNKVATGISANLDVGRIIFDRNNPNNMIMATAQGMYRSTDLGETWSSSATGLPNNRPRDLTSYYNESTNEFILYAIEQTYYIDNAPSISSTGGIYKSTNGGVSWQSITGNLALNMQSITNFTTRDTYHRTIAQWFGITKNQSKSKYTTYPTSVLPTFNRIVVNPTNKDEIYLVQNKRHTFSFGPGDVWKTTNGGATWIAASRSGLYWINNNDMSYWQSRNNPTGTNIEYSHMQAYMDNKYEESSAARMLAINVNGDVFTGIDQQLLRSNNGGTSWEQADDIEASPNSNTWIGRGNNNLPGRFMLLETGVPGRKLLCSGEHGLWKTTGTTSSPIANNVVIEQIEGQVHDHSGNTAAHTATAVAAHPTNPDIIYILISRQEHRGKLRRTTNGGQTWSNIATIFEASNNEFENLAYQNSLLIDPVTPNNMYFCATRESISEVGRSENESILTKGEYGVYRSTNGGFNWAASNSGLPANCSVRRLTMDPNNSNVLYASLNKFNTNSPAGGLYKSTNGAQSWNPVSIPTAIKAVNNFFIDRNTGFMFISAGVRNGELDEGGVWKSEDSGTTWQRIFEAPYVWQTEVSPANSNIITVSVAAQTPDKLNDFLNPGVYVSLDAGATWTKINKGLAHSDRIVDVKPDPDDETVLWAAGWGSGWYKAKIPEASLSVAEEVKIEQPKMMLYPNPVNNGTLQLRNIKPNSKYIIWDIRGKSLLRGTVSEGKNINVSNLSTGMYIIKVLSIETSTSETRKFIVK